MKVLLMKDVYKLGRAGDIKKVADGYGRNFLLPQKLAVLATEGALKQVQKIKSQAEITRNTQNNELAGVADQIKAVTLTFPAKAGDTGKLYGSITTQDIASALSEQIKFEIKRQQVGIQPIRSLGEVTGNVRLTMDLVPEFKIVVHREGESAETVTAVAPAAVEEEKVEKKKGGKAKDAAKEVKEAPATEETAVEEAPAAE
jgi:large subunit ribosomal protein L9